MFANKLVSLISIALCSLVLACSADGGTPAPVDAPATDMSICGHPGDPGNELGVGKYCTSLTECSGLQAGLCSVIGDARAHFCTKTCAAGQGVEACGTNATCQCQGGLCGCTPNACL